MEKGDYIYDPNTGVSFIFKEWVDPVTWSVFCALSDDVLKIGGKGIGNPRGTINNPEIIQELDRALFKEGYYFDTDKLEMSEKRWDSGIDEDYYVPTFEYLCSEDYELGIMCKTKEEALILEKVALDAIRKYLTNKK